MNGLLVVDKPGRPSVDAMTDDYRNVLRAPAPGPIVASQLQPVALSALPSTGSTYLLTSHDVVSRVRRWSGERRIGHTGTLDPMASGVLLLCLGQATRLVEYYQGERKQYYAEIVLGQATDTYDAVGVVTATSLIPTLANQTIESTLDRFRGEFWQQPPTFSAIKQGGEPLHQKARRGEAITVAPRCVTFSRIDLLDFHPPDRIALRVLCSAGAYIRSLAHDLGLALGTHACLDVLRREAAGAFSLHEAYTLDVVEDAAKDGRLGDLLIPPGYGLPMPIVPVEMDAMRRLGFGQIVRLPTNTCDDRGVARAHDDQGRLAGIVRCLRPADDEQDVWLWKAEKWMN